MTANKELENQITQLLESDGKTVSFKYDWVDIPTKNIGQLSNIRNQEFQKAEVAAFTKNKTTGETFLLKSTIGDTHTECLQKILDFLNKANQTMSVFTVHWAKKENGQLGPYNTSYFTCHDIVEVVNKFFAGKSVKDYVIYDIKLNPIA